MKIKDKILKGCRKIYRSIFHPIFVDPVCEELRKIEKQKKLEKTEEINLDNNY